MPLSSSGGSTIYGAPTTPAPATTERDYQRENELGISKITDVDPALGASMERAYQNRTEHSESLLSGMWNAVTAPLRKTVEGLGNIGSAVAEPFRDEESETQTGNVEQNDADNALSDIWQGLTGQENTIWRDNLVSYGADKDSWTTNVLGLAGDVLADPTTYIGAGGLGVARSVVATGAKELGEHAALGLIKKEMKERGGLYIGKNKDVLIKSDEELVQFVAETSTEQFRAMGVSDELVHTLGGIAAGNADNTLLRGLDDLGQMEATWVGERIGSAVLQRKSIQNLPKEFVSPLGRTWKRDDMVKVFNETSRLGPEEMNKLANEVYGGQVGYGTSGMMGRKSAAALGGLRLKFGMPFSGRIGNANKSAFYGYRWQSQAIPMTHRFKIFGSAQGSAANKMGDFFRGLSGINRLDTAIQQSIANGSDTWQKTDMEKFLRLGFTKFEHRMIDEGRGAEFHKLFGDKSTTMFMSASDRMGGITAHLTPKAQEWRRVGYTGLKSGHEIRNAQIGKRVFREYASQHEGEWSLASRKLEEATKKGELDGAQVHDDMIKYLEGTSDNLDVLPDYLRVPARQMKEMFPRVIKEAKKQGAEVGDVMEVFARRRSETALKVHTDELTKVTDELAKAQKNMANEQELFAAEVGEDVAQSMMSPKVAAAQEKIASLQKDMTRVLESQKSVELEIDMLDETDRMIRALRPNWTAEKAGPKNYFHRRLTSEAKEGIRGSLVAKYKSHGKANLVTAQLERVLAHMSHADSAKYLRKIHPEALGKVKKVWEDNPFGVYAAYVEDMSEAVYKAQLKGAANHVMGALGGVDNGLAMRITAHVPADFYPRNIAMDAVKARGGVAQKFSSLHDLIDRVHTSIGAKVPTSSHTEGTAAWANHTKSMKELVAATGGNAEMIGTAWKHVDSALGDSAEYMRVEDIEDLIDNVDQLRTIAEPEKVAKIAESVKKRGWERPVQLDYDPKSRRIIVSDGHHRIQAAKNLRDEGFEPGAYIPVGIRRNVMDGPGDGAYFESMGVEVKTLDDAHRNGANFDWDQFEFVPQLFRPSELFAQESGRIGKIGTLTDEEAMNLSVTLHELNRAKSQAHGLVAEPEVAFKKLEADVDMSMWGRLDIPGLEEFAMHPYMAAEFNKAYQGMKSLPQWRKNWRKFVMGPWKKGATIYSPGFHARNFMGAWYNNTLGGVNDQHYFATHKVMDVITNGKKSKHFGDTYGKGMMIDGETYDKVTYGDLANLMQTRGITGGNSLAVADLRSFLGKRVSSGITGKRVLTSKMSIGKIGRHQSKTFGDVTYAEDFMRRWERWGISKSNTTENFFRGAAFLRGLEEAAGDTAGARMFTMMRHGDYEELTDFENGIRDLIPFYKWMRTNLPFQIRRMTENPAMQMATLDVQNALIPPEERKEFTSYMRDALTIPMPKALAKAMGSKDAGGILTAQLPLHDLYLSSGEFASSFLPVVKQVVESGVLKKSLFTGAPLEGTNMVEASGWMHTTGLAHVLQAVGWGEEGEDGKVYFTDREMNLANAFPLFARSRAFLTEDPDRTQLRMASFTSFMAGVRPEALDLNEGEREWFFEVLDPQLTQLREMEYKLPTAYDLGAAVNQNTGTSNIYGG